MSADVFISYARVDHAAADRIASALQEAGVVLWWDALLLPGETFDEKIQNIVAEANVFVGLLSPTSMLSDWVRWELSQAVANGLHVIPILVDGVVPEDLAPPLSLVHAIVLPNLEPVALRECAVQVREAVDMVSTRSARRGKRDRDARRRLALAASETAQRARDIKQRNRRIRAETTASHQACEYSASPGLADLLESLDVSLAITSPDAGKLYLVGSGRGGQVSIAATEFDQPTGVVSSGSGLVISARTALHTLQNVLHPEQLYDGRYSHCFVERTSHFLGSVAPHDLAATTDGLRFVSSRYSCVAELSPTHSFGMVWKPSFVTEIVPEDRCHLNGLAVEDGALAYATGFGESNTIDGWRTGLIGGGVVLGIRSDEVVCRGLTMPHSPRMHGGRLWLLNSGSGELGFVPEASSGGSVFEPVASLPGFARGLAFAGPLAFAGISRPRHESFAGLELHDRMTRDSEAARTGVAVIDTRSGDRVEWLWLEDQAREVYDVALLPAVRCPTAYSADSIEANGLITMEQQEQLSVRCAAGHGSFSTRSGDDASGHEADDCRNRRPARQQR